MARNKDWLVRVYHGKNIVNKWVIEDRTENEAVKEAESDIERESGYMRKDFDWTMTSIKKRKLKKVV